jgi:DNA repair protein RAD57
MTDLLHTIPDFPTQTYTHLLPSLEKHLITTADLLTLDAREIAKRAQVPVLDVRRLANQVVEIIRGGFGLVTGGGRDADINEDQDGEGSDRTQVGREWRSISTLDHIIDAALGGGIPTGYVTEFTGER